MYNANNDIRNFDSLNTTTQLDIASGGEWVYVEIQPADPPADELDGSYDYQIKSNNGYPNDLQDNGDPSSVNRMFPALTSR